MRILALRFSAMGDVALLAPVLSAIARRNAGVGITLVTRKAFEPFFYNIPGVEVIGVDVDREYRGLRGLYRLYRELKSLGPYDVGIDLHGSTRSRILKFFFRRTGLRFENLVKGRREKNKQIRRNGKELFPLPHTVERYLAAVERAGLKGTIGSGPWIHPDTQARAIAFSFLKDIGLQKKDRYWIGIAPFAGHDNKMWPIDNVRELVNRLHGQGDSVLFLFGGGARETAILEDLSAGRSDIHVMAGKLPLEGELALIMRLDAMVAMDSLNMHLAALLSVPVLSIWGPTHPYSGFGPYGQGEEAIVQVPVDELPCRPCSIFGNKPCFRKDLACMHRISPSTVVARLHERLQHGELAENMPQTD